MLSEPREDAGDVLGRGRVAGADLFQRQIMRVGGRRGLRHRPEARLERRLLGQDGERIRYNKRGEVPRGRPCWRRGGRSRGQAALWQAQRRRAPSPKQEGGSEEREDVANPGEPQKKENTTKKRNRTQM